MPFWKTLFGGATLEKEEGSGEERSSSAMLAEEKSLTCRLVKDSEQRFPSLSKEALRLIQEALQIVEKQVEVHRDFVSVQGTGAEGPVMDVARKLELAHGLHPESALLHFGYGSGLHVASQFKSAEEVMKACLLAHPDFPLARFAVEGWGQWKSPFTLPVWTRDSVQVPQAISDTVKTNIILSVRDGILPRATFFYRDAVGDFKDLHALQNARIELATVVSMVNTPPVVGVYGRIYDDPTNPFNLEVLRIPFLPRGNPARSTYEYLCVQEDLDFVVIDSQDRILMNKRLPFSKRMKEQNQNLLKLLLETDGREISNEELVTAIHKHQRQFSHSDVRF